MDAGRERELTKYFYSLFQGEGWILKRELFASTLAMMLMLSEGTQPGARILDIGAGESKYRPFFPACDYLGIDLAVGEADFSHLDAIADAHWIPFVDGCADLVLLMVVLEHVQNPLQVLQECRRVLRERGKLVALVPLTRPEHQAPHDFFRYTRYGAAHLMRQAGFRIDHLEPSNGALMTALHYSTTFWLRICRSRLVPTRPLKAALAFAVRQLVLRAMLPLVRLVERHKRHESFPIYFNLIAEAMSHEP
jgi:SAM-dependent methyltransferase